MYMRLLAFLCLMVPFSAVAELPDFTEIVEDAAPAVVKILVEAEMSGRVESDQMDQVPEYLRRFFEFRGDQAPRERPRRNMGSGFVVSEDGYIVTNHHVVEGASSVVVRMIDRREFDAEVIGSDVRSDLALLKIDAEDLVVLPIAQDDDVSVGEWVLAIGSPFGLDFSVTA